MRKQSSQRMSVPLATLLAFGLAACASTALAQDQGVCVTAHVAEAFTLPDGRVHAAGKITLCSHRLLNPVAGLHRIRVDDDGFKLVVSRRSRPREYSGTSPVMLFRRDSGGVLALIGYSVPFDRGAWTYALQRAERKEVAEPTTLAAARTTGDVVTLLASNGD